ncbi:MAG: Zn-dependent hydrolase [Deltaproteobacteria bacterium]|nr:Zn-dependent hydrolase [Deltaproteobacteria bacterium]
MEYQNLRVNGRRLQESLEEMARIGATEGGGVHRLALSEEDKQARDLFVKWLQEIGLKVTIDDMGNIFGRRPGKKDDLPSVMCGSHIDTQPKGGRFDGILGVMGGLEVLRTLNDNEIETLRSIVVANWTNEEGTRFSPPMAGSGVWTGKLDKHWIYDRTDMQGKKFGEELERIGYKGNILSKPDPIYAYFEYHIEQGPVLEKENMIIGAPEGIVGMRWCDVYVSGTANQVGPTPMEGRNDALCAAAEMILTINALPQKMGGNMVATVGEIHNFPNSRNIIPDHVHFTVDIRSWDDDRSQSAWIDAKENFQAIANRRGCSVRIEETWQVDHMPFDQRLVTRVLDTAQQLGYPVLKMRSGAGHDAGYLSMVAPTAMIFVPSIGGRSHVEVENTKWEDCESGANVLLQCMLQCAMEA